MAMLSLAGYQEIEILYASIRTLVYRALRIADGQSIILKVLRNERPTFYELVKFRNQYMITRYLDSIHIVRPHALERYGNGYALVMPDEGAVALSHYWPQARWEVREFLQIAIQLAEALHDLAQYRIIHKDIKPSNILIHPESHRVKLIDFSISTLLPKQQQQLTNPNVLEGTLAYISPEQTGRTNRGIDYRTDFYSLGVTFFELLTGKLPFETTDPMELVYCHIAQMPSKWPQNRDVPPILSDIVLKLMAKNPEDRYQNALGLKFDLERCLQQLDATGNMAPFELGQQDISDRFLIPEQLYGREAEVQILLDAFDRTAKGNTEMMLVAGFSGIGKTAVINEVHKPIVRRRGYFIQGKFDQFQRNIPFSAFVGAFRDLMKQLLGSSDEELAAWKAKILNALGANGQVIIEVVPELERIIGPQPSAAELSGSAARNRFNVLFGQFVRVFTAPEHPLVIFLDDLQWADSASLDLIKLLMEASPAPYLLLLGAYRDNEVFPAHPLLLTLAEIRKQGTHFHTLTLPPLAQSDITAWVADTLLCDRDTARPLSELVYQKTQGNPFFTTQFLKGLHEDGWITFAQDRGCWQCDLSQVRKLSLRDDVVAFTVERLLKLPDATREVLKLAACIGNQFDLNTLAVACDRRPEVVGAELWIGLQEGFVIPNSENYKFFQGANVEESLEEEATFSYCFLHDRIQQAAYALIPQATKAQTHLKIGQLLLQHTSESERNEHIFEIVNQFNYGSFLLQIPSERHQLAELNAIAARKAKAATAYAAASDYLNIARELLMSESWQIAYHLTLELYILSAEIAYLQADFEKMEEFSRVVLERAETVLERASIYEIKLSALTSQVKPKQALDMGLEVLELLDVHFQQDPDPAYIQQELESVAELFADRKIADLADAPEMCDRQKQAALRILAAIVSPAYITAPLLLPSIIIRMVRLSVVYGNAPLSGFAYSLYGLILSGVVGDLDTGYQFGQLALKIVDRFNASELKTKVNYTVGVHIIHGKYHVKEALPLIRESYRKGLETAELELGYAAKEICQYSYLTGENLCELEPEVEKYCQAIARYKQNTAFNHMSIVRQAILNLLARDDRPYVLIGDAYDEETMRPFYEAANDRSGLHYFYFHKLWLCYLFQQKELALASACAAEQYLDAVTGMLNVPTFYFYDALARLSLCQQADEFESEHREQVNRDLDILQKWADSAPMNFAHKLALIEAEKLRVFGQKIQAMEYYDLAIDLARTHQYIQEEALANELAAQFYLDWGKEKIARTYLTDAYYAYAQWGSRAKTHQLEKQYPKLLSYAIQEQIELNAFSALDRFTQTFFSTVQTTSSSTGLSDSLDFLSLLQAARVISSTLDLEELLAKICKIILTNSGAEKAVLLVCESDCLQLRAIAQLSHQGEIEVQTESQPLAPDSPVPLRLIQYVKNTQEVVSNESSNPEVLTTLESDRLQSPLQSVLCLPLVDREKTIGILYLEHSTARGVFTSSRQLVVKFLCAQAVISLQNALLYDRIQQTFQEVQRVQVQLSESESRLKQFLEALPVGMTIHDASGALIDVNQVGKSLLNIDIISPKSYDELSETFQIYRSDTQIIYPVDELPAIRALKGEVVHSENLELHQGDRVVPLEVWASPIFNDKGDIVYAITAFQDIRARKEAQEQLIYNALHDSLTDLPNRSLLVKRLELAIDRYQRNPNSGYAVLFLDLDNFKVVNDSLGHLIGDRLLVSVAQRLQKLLRPSDLAARLGGDEFVILLEDIQTVRAVLRVAERIATNFKTAITTEEHNIFITTSMGIVFGTPAYTDASDILRDADIALYQAKDRGRGRYEIFDAGMHTQALERLNLENELRRAINQHPQQEFTIHYQPIVALETGYLVGFEALVRWNHPTRGLISPAEFVPVAEETGSIVALDFWMLRQACAQLACWQKQFPEKADLKISVNLAEPDLREPTLMETIASSLEASGLNASCLTLEITESMLIENIETTIDLLANLRSRGIQISIDDFGTGYSSLSYLYNLPADFLKIDRSFVCQMKEADKNYKIVQAIVMLGHQLQLKTVVEGIETSQHIEWLRQFGCQFGQGYYISRPLTCEAATTLLAERSHWL